MSYYQLIEFESDSETDCVELKKCTLPRRLQSAIAGNNRSNSFIFRRSDNTSAFPDGSTNSFSLPSSPKGIKTMFKFPFGLHKAKNDLRTESEEKLEKYFYDDKKAAKPHQR